MIKLPHNSLFAVLSRSPWWVSTGLGLGIFLLMRIWLPLEMAVFGALPFIGIGCYAGYLQLKRPGAKRIARTLERARALPAEEFRAALAEGFKRDGFSAEPANGGADLVLTNKGRVTLVACKRWKAGRTGIEPLREFEAATRERGAHARMYVAVGEVTDNARTFAAENRIQLLQEEDLAKLLRL